jgi:hypothetical protein
MIDLCTLICVRQEDKGIPKTSLSSTMEDQPTSSRAGSPTTAEKDILVSIIYASYFHTHPLSILLENQRVKLS